MPAAARTYRRYHRTHQDLKDYVMVSPETLANMIGQTTDKPRRQKTGIDRTAWDMERATRAAADLRKLVTETVGEEDADLIRDTVEGETDIVDTIRDTVEAVLMLNAQIEGIKRHIERMEDRTARMEAKATRLRGLIHQAMATAEIDSLPLDIATLTRKPAAQSVIVTDEALIPARFWKPSDPKLDKRALLDALKAGGTAILGAELSNGGETLQIRSK